MSSHIVHFSYHKCLTVFYGGVLRAIWPTYQHCNSWIDLFYERQKTDRITSVNNQSIDFSRLQTPYAASHFIRDPRDLVVSGYFYHKRGAEAWCRIPWPDEMKWQAVNGTIPEGLVTGQSYAEFLESISLEDGLIAEMQFRKKHFEAMEAWDYQNPRCIEIRYEDFVHNEIPTLHKIFDHYLLEEESRIRGLDIAEKHRVGRNAFPGHIRDPEPEQWKKYFTPRLQEYFGILYPSLLAKTGYSW